MPLARLERTELRGAMSPRNTSRLRLLALVWDIGPPQGQWGRDAGKRAAWCGGHGRMGRGKRLLGATCSPLWGTLGHESLL